jgi:hypothetical protein
MIQHFKRKAMQKASKERNLAHKQGEAIIEFVRASRERQDQAKKPSVVEEATEAKD